MKYELTKLSLASGLKDIILYRLATSVTLENATCYVNTYQNGREAGYEISVYLPKQPIKKVTITEYRNSDQIVVYHDNTACQGLTEDAYKNTKVFNYNDYNGVIEHCTNYLGAL
jgi:hypothetical protein